MAAAAGVEPVTRVCMMNSSLHCSAEVAHDGSQQQAGGPGGMFTSPGSGGGAWGCRQLFSSNALPTQGRSPLQQMRTPGVSQNRGELLIAVPPPCRKVITGSRFTLMRDLLGTICPQGIATMHSAPGCYVPCCCVPLPSPLSPGQSHVDATSEYGVVVTYRLGRLQVLMAAEVDAQLPGGQDGPTGGQPYVEMKTYT